MEKRKNMRESEHYFTGHPTSQHRPQLLRVHLRGRDYRFETDSGVFSKDRIDPGTRLLLEAVDFPREGRLLDWGCGYGVIGIVAAAETSMDVWMIDINQRAVTLAKRNAQLNETRQVNLLCADGLSGFGELSFDLILANPPIRSGNRVVYRLIAEAHRSLAPGGQFYLVAQTKQGARSLAQQMESLFANVETVERGGGYRVLRSVRLRD